MSNSRTTTTEALCGKPDKILRRSALCPVTYSVIAACHALLNGSISLTAHISCGTNLLVNNITNGAGVIVRLLANYISILRIPQLLTIGVGVINLLTIPCIVRSRCIRVGRLACILRRVVDSVECLREGESLLVSVHCSRNSKYLVVLRKCVLYSNTGIVTISRALLIDSYILNTREGRRTAILIVETHCVSSICERDVCCLSGSCRSVSCTEVTVENAVVSCTRLDAQSLRLIGTPNVSEPYCLVVLVEKHNMGVTLSVVTLILESNSACSSVVAYIVDKSCTLTPRDVSVSYTLEVACAINLARGEREVLSLTTLRNDVAVCYALSCQVSSVSCSQLIEINSCQRTNLRTVNNDSIVCDNRVRAVVGSDTDAHILVSAGRYYKVERSSLSAAQLNILAVSVCKVEGCAVVGSCSELRLICISKANSTETRKSIPVARVVTKSNRLHLLRTLEFNLHITTEVTECQTTAIEVSASYVLLVAEYSLATISHRYRRKCVLHHFCAGIVYRLAIIRIDSILCVGRNIEISYIAIYILRCTLGDSTVSRNCTNGITLAPNYFTAITAIDKSGT